MSIFDNIDTRRSIYTGTLTFIYLSCPHCGGKLHSYGRACHPHGHRWFTKCPDCTYRAWEGEEHNEILLRMELERAEVMA